MSTTIEQTNPSSAALWTGRVFSGLTAAFMLVDGALHLVKPAPVIQAFHQLGLPIQLSLVLGIIEFVCVLAYLWPRTRIVGAILLTGYLGGAVAMQLRVGNPLFGETLFPVYVGILVWAGLYLRDFRLRRLIPIVESTSIAEQDSPVSLPSQLTVAQS